MPVYLSPSLNPYFPGSEYASDDGLLAIGGKLSPEWLIHAYRSGVFPWFNHGEPYQWWCPDPRFVMKPSDIKVARSMKSMLRNPRYSFRINSAFEKVIKQCAGVKRNGQGGTWITDEMQDAYLKLHKLGFAHSAEAYCDGILVGGLYGVSSGAVFFGESMFSNISNASKYAFIRFVELLREWNFELIDCQVYSQHLESLGARMMPRVHFLAAVADAIVKAESEGIWTKTNAANYTRD